ncbi:MAG: branched-chain amino acid transaminase [Proteobacteria bacterium]|nr:branched-chain amino acid transaminase [Pseudomonadota bacterium]
MSMKADWMWMNGQLIPWDQATVHVFAHALHYGSSVFEGIRAYSTPKGPALFRGREHMRRLHDSAKIIRMPVAFSVDELIEATKSSIRANKQESCYIRPLIFRGYESLGIDGRKCPVEIIIGAIPWGIYLGDDAIEKGVDVVVSSWRRMAPGTGSSLAKIGGNYVNSQLIVMEAKEMGFMEGITLDVNGYLSEGSGENLFLIRDGEIHTPPLSSSILAGITRHSAITIANDLGYEVREAYLTRDLLYLADELFFTGTAVEITPVRSVDRISIGSGSRGPITKAIQERFFAITAGEVDDTYGWLDHVYADGEWPL